jgi:hypothetical protein
MVLANKATSDILVQHGEMTKENANSIAKLICDKINEIVRIDEKPELALIELLAK